MKHYVHINQHAIKANHKTGDRGPVITIKTYKSNQYASEIEIRGKIRLVYSPDAPLSCGARVWIEFDDGDATIEIVK